MANTSTGASALSFNFAPMFSVRAVLRDGEPWFVAKDVMGALDYADTSNPSRVIAHVPDEWRGVNPIHTPSGEQQMVTLSEQGLYFFLGRSDKPKALPFQKWLAGEVLPAIRKTGRYVDPAAPAPACAAERITSNDLINIKRLIWQVVGHFRFHSAWNQAVWFYLRKVLHLPSPAPLTVDHLPIVSRELAQMASITDRVHDLVRDIEAQAIRRIFRKGESADVVLADLKRLADARMVAISTEQHSLPSWLQRDLQAITQRSPAVPCAYLDNEQPGYFGASS